MRIKHVVAILVGAPLCALLATSCITSASTPEAGEQVEPALEEMASLRNPWVFTVTKEYDGKDGAGGEQEAAAPIGFVTESIPPHYFSCHIRVRMPVCTVKHGMIAKRYAAEVTLKVSDEAADSMDWRYWGEPTNVYCLQFIEKMQNIFRERYRGLGARVTG